jgi:protein-tyrosine-phosphatase
MAAGLIRARLAAEGRDGRVVVTSAGTWAQPDLPPLAESVQAVADYGVDIADCRSREVTAEDMAAADLVLAMTESHRMALLAEFPAARGRVLLVSELAGGSWDIADPVGQPLAAHQATAGELARLIDIGWGRILGEVA